MLPTPATEIGIIYDTTTNIINSLINPDYTIELDTYLLQPNQSMVRMPKTVYGPMSIDQVVSTLSTAATSLNLIAFVSPPLGTIPSVGPPVGPIKPTI